MPFKIVDNHQPPGLPLFGSLVGDFVVVVTLGPIEPILPRIRPDPVPLPLS